MVLYLERCGFRELPVVLAKLQINELSLIRNTVESLASYSQANIASLEAFEELVFSSMPLLNELPTWDSQALTNLLTIAVERTALVTLLEWLHTFAVSSANKNALEMFAYGTPFCNALSETYGVVIAIRVPDYPPQAATPPRHTTHIQPAHSSPFSLCSLTATATDVERSTLSMETSPPSLACVNAEGVTIAMGDPMQLQLQQQPRNGYQEFVDLFMVITVGIATFVVLFRVAFTIFPMTAKPASGNAQQPTANAASAVGAQAGARGSRARTSATLNGTSAAAAQRAVTPVGPNGNGTLKRHFSVKERLESEIRSILPRRSTYYAMPFFSDSVVNKQEFIESLIELGDDLLDGWLLVKKGVQRGKNWKKRYVVLDGNGRIKYYPNADAARRNINIKGSLAVHAVKPADPLEFGANTLEIRGTLGGTYFFRAEDDLAARKWLCVMTKRAIQGRVPGRIDSNLSSAVLASANANVGSSPVMANGVANGKDVSSSAEAAENALAASASNVGEALSATNLKSHGLEVFVEDMSYTKEGSLRQFYIVVKYKSELHDHSQVPVGQSVPKPCEKGVVTWQEKLSWHFQDHACAECDECRAIGSTSGSFCGLPDIMVLHVYEIHLRYLTTKVGETAISLREMFGFTGMKEAQVSCSWPVTSPSDSILGQLSLKLQYSVNNAPGASVTPFLVSSEQERELIGEYEIHPAIKNCVEYFEMFYANGQAEKWQDYYKARGDSEMDIGEWTQSKEYGGQVRVLSCRSLTNASIGPSSTMNTTTQHIFFTDLASADPDKFVLESKAFLHDIPYGDCFHVEQVTIIEKGASGNLVAKVYLGIPFSKGCMFKSKIISATREGVSSSMKLCYEMLNKTIDSPAPDASTTTAPVTPFLVSKEEERSLLGEYEVHPAVKDGLHFFDLYYANNTQKRWEGYIKAGGDSEHDYGEWTDSQEFGGQVRTIKYRAQSNSSLGPPSTMATQTQHVPFNSKRENANPDHFVLETKMALHDIPYGDSFTIETVFEVTREVDGKLMARAYIGIPFSKSTMFKSKIASATKEGMVKSTKMLFDELRKAMDKETSGGGATGNINGAAAARTDASASASDAGAMVAARNSDVGANRPSGGAAVPRRAVLARYNSNLDGSVALEEIFENQRVSIFGKWGPNHLLPTDRERFTNRNGDVELSFEQITLPPHWIWTSPWKIDKNYTECDDEGWSYATDFPRFKLHLARGKSSMKRLGASVRRRRWIRMMCYVPPENGGGAIAAAGAPSEA